MATVLSILVDSAGLLVSLGYCVVLYSLYTDDLKKKLGAPQDADTEMVLRNHIENLYMWAIMSFVCACSALLREALDSHSCALMMFFAIQVVFERSATHLWTRAQRAVQRSVSLIDREPVGEIPLWQLPSRIVCLAWTAGLAFTSSAIVFDIIAEARDPGTESEARATVQVLLTLMGLLFFAWHILAYHEARITRYEGLHFFLQCSLVISALHVSSSASLLPFRDIRLATGVIGQSIVCGILAAVEFIPSFRTAWMVPVVLTALSLIILAGYSAFALLYHEGMDTVANSVGVLVNVILLAGMYHITRDSIAAFSSEYGATCLRRISPTSGLHPHAEFTIDDSGTAPSPQMELTSITGLVMPAGMLEDSELDPDPEQELRAVT